MKSGRVFDELEIDMDFMDKKNMDNLIAIVEEHGSTIKQLTMDNFYERSNYKVNAEDLIKFFENLPNLNNWTITAGCDIFRDVIGKCEPVLKNLRSFTVHDEFMSYRLFEKLSSFIASDSVESLFINSEINYEKFITRQCNLKSIGFEELDLVKYLTKNLKLEEVNNSADVYDEDDEEVDDANNILLQLIREQKELQKIDFLGLPMSATVVETICQLTPFLQSLSLKITDDNVANLLEIHQLKELKDLTIAISKYFSLVDSFFQLTELEMPSVKKLKIVLMQKIAIDFDPIAENLGNHWKNVEEFEVDFKVKSINSILQNMQNLKSLTVHCASKAVLEHDSSSYPSLERLKIVTCYSDRYWILSTHLLEALPNLSFLNVYGCLYESGSHINVLKEMPKLRKLEMSFYVKSSETVPTLDDVLAIRKLCRSTKEFNITFSTRPGFKFTQELATLLENESDVIKQNEIRNYGNKLELAIENFKY